MQSVANMLEQLKDAPYEFFIFTSNRDLDNSSLENVEPGKWIQYNNNAKIYYAAGQEWQQLKKELNAIKPDILFINGIYSWPFSFLPLLFAKVKTTIISARGMLHPGALSQKHFKKKVYLGFWKLLGLHKKNIFHATDEEEKKYIQAVFGKGVTIKIAANFPRIFSAKLVQGKKSENLKLVSIALISPMKNHLMVLQALEECHENIEYNIYGPVKEEAYWFQCIEQIKKLPSNITVNYNGDIPPADIEKVLEQNHVFILPSKSENFGHAIYEALSSGRPVITSTATPWKDLKNVQAGINVSNEQLEELSAAIHFFAAMSQDELIQWSEGAKAYAEKAIDVERTREAYVEMLRKG